MSKTRGDEKLLTTPTIRLRLCLNCKLLPPSLLCLLKSKGSRDAPSYLRPGLHQPLAPESNRSWTPCRGLSLPFQLACLSVVWGHPWVSWLRHVSRGRPCSSWVSVGQTGPLRFPWQFEPHEPFLLLSGGSPGSKGKRGTTAVSFLGRAGVGRLLGRKLFPFPRLGD